MLFEKYRPQSWDEVVGQEDNIRDLKGILAKCKSSGVKAPNLMFVGPAGNGKTTCAQIFAKNYLGSDWKTRTIELNASDSRRISDIRETVKPLSRTAVVKVIIMDESDRLTTDSQHAMRRIMETSPTTTFILIGNNEWEFIEPIKSRCTFFSFTPLTDEQVFAKLLDVCNKENISINYESENVKAGFRALISYAKGDLRKAIGNLERLITSGKEISESNVAALEPINLVRDTLGLAFRGYLVGAKDKFLDQYIMTAGDSKTMVRAFFDVINEVPDMEVKARLWNRLADIEHNILHGADPMIQFIAFVSFAWVVPHVPKACPVVSKELM